MGWPFRGFGRRSFVFENSSFGGATDSFSSRSFLCTDCVSVYSNFFCGVSVYCLSLVLRFASIVLIWACQFKEFL